MSMMGSSQKKRKHREDHDEGDREYDREDAKTSNQSGMDQTLPLPHQPDLPEFNLTSARPSSRDAGSPPRDDGEEWQTIENGRPTKKKKIPKKTSNNYPEIHFSRDSKLQSQIKISDLQNLVLYILADGTSPQFVSVRHRNQIRKVVVLMIPGLEQSMFELTNRNISGEIESSKTSKRDGDRRNHDSQDPSHYPQELNSEKLPDSVQAFAEMFEYIWPVKTPGDERYGKMHSPLHAMLTAPMPQNRQDKKNDRKKGASKAQEPAGWKDTRTPITEFLQPVDALLENDYTIHPAMYEEGNERTALDSQRIRSKTSKDDGWVDTLVENFADGLVPDNEYESGSLTAGREVLAMDCEMCKTGEQEFSLTRISIVRWDGSVVMDELVKPEKPIIDYLTMYSGITEKMLEGVTTTLADIQKKLLEVLHPHTILVGHSLNSDLTALKITHPFIIDTSIIFPHPRGPPLKSSLKWLAQKYLNREIQKGHGASGPGAGHDSIEDARTCLDLVKQKCEKGVQWGTSDAAGENIFKRLARSGVKYKNQGGSAVPSPMNARTSAAVDWGNPKLGAGNAATFTIGCTSDEEVMEGVIRAVKGDPDGLEIPGVGVDFVFGRMRELEALKGWWNNNKNAVEPTAELSTTSTTALPPPVTISPTTPISEATAALTSRLSKIYASLPPCTAFIIYSGSGDPRDMSRLQAMHTQYKREYKIKKWDDLSIKWTDTEEQDLRRAVREARQGIAFMGVK